MEGWFPMAVAPLIAMKSTKCESLEAVARELDRRAHTYVNDVDPMRSGLNEVYCCERDGKPLTLDEAVEQRVGELHTKRAVRKDAVKAMGFIVSTNDALSDERASEFLNDALRWFAKRYGQENMLGAAIHYDEDTPHLHLWLAPVISEDGWDRLCAAKLFTPDKRERFDEDGNKLEKGQEPEKGKVVWKVTERGTMSVLQEDFWREVASKYGYDRPLDRETRGKGYRSLEAYKTHVGTTRALRREVDKAREAKADAEEEAKEAAGKVEGILDKAREDAKKAAEEEAKGILDKAREDAQAEANGIVEKAREDAQAEANGIVEKAREDAQAEANGIVADAQTKADGIVDAARQQLREVVWPLVRRVVRLVEQRLDAYRRQPTPEDIDAEAWDALVEATDERGRDEQEPER